MFQSDMSGGKEPQKRKSLGVYRHSIEVCHPEAVLRPKDLSGRIPCEISVVIPTPASRAGGSAVALAVDSQLLTLNSRLGSSTGLHAGTKFVSLRMLGWSS